MQFAASGIERQRVAEALGRGRGAALPVEVFADPAQGVRERVGREGAMGAGPLQLRAGASLVTAGKSRDGEFERGVAVARAAVQQALQVFDRADVVAALIVEPTEVPIAVRPVGPNAARVRARRGRAGVVAADLCEDRLAGGVVLPLARELREPLLQLRREVEAERLERSVPFVVQERAPRDHEPVTEQSQPQAEVVVLEVAVAEPLVELADLGQRLAPQHEAQPGERVDVLYLARLVRECVAHLGAHGGCVRAAHGQLRRPLHEVAHGCDGPDRGIAGQHAMLFLEHVLGGLRVVVEHEHERQPRGSQPDVHPAGEPQVLLLAQHPNHRRHRRELRRPIRTRVVDEQHLELLDPALLQQARQTRPGQLHTAMARNDHRTTHVRGIDTSRPPTRRKPHRTSPSSPPDTDVLSVDSPDRAARKSRSVALLQWRVSVGTDKSPGLHCRQRVTVVRPHARHQLRVGLRCRSPGPRVRPQRPPNPLARSAAGAVREPAYAALGTDQLRAAQENHSVPRQSAVAA